MRPGPAEAPALTIPGVLQRAAQRAPGAPALADDHRQLTFAELWHAVSEAAAAVVAAGVLPGDRLALWAPNSVDWAVVAAGALAAGAAVVPLNTRFTTGEVAAVLARAGCRLAVAQGAFLGRNLAAELTEAVPRVPVLALGGRPGDGLAGWDAVGASVSDAHRGEVGRRLQVLGGDDIAYVQFTSGTTGRPKGAMLRHAAMVRTTTAWVAAVGLGPGDRYPVVSPFSHIAGHKTGLLAGAVAGALVVPVAVYEARSLAVLIADREVTFLQGPPTMFHELVALARDRSAPRWPGLRVGVTGAASIPPALIRDMREVLGLDQVFTAYGLTEASGVCTITAASDPAELVATTSGRPLAGIEVATAGPGGLLASGKQGEIVVRGFNLMAGYLGDAESTAAVIRDGWLHTGDVGWLGDDGCLRIVDRLTDMVVVGGNNAYPAEVERVLLGHEGVGGVAVIGVPDDRLGEVTAAFVQPRRPGLTAEALQSYCRERLARYKVPRHVWFVDRLPVNATGKVTKGALRAEARRLLGVEQAGPAA